MTGRVQDWNRQSMKKGDSAPKHGVRSMGSLFHSNAPVMLADGGRVDEAAMKQRGLAESNKEKPMGLFERLRMGNIDQPGSEAYNRFGAGRGRMEGELDKAEAEMKANRANARAGDAAMRQRKVDDADFAEADALQATGRAVAGAPAPAPARRQVSRVETPAAATARPVARGGSGDRPPSEKARSGTDARPPSETARSARQGSFESRAKAPAKTTKAAEATRGRTSDYRTQLERRGDRLAAERASRSAEAQAFNERLRQDPGQISIRAAQKEWDNMSPAQRSSARGRQLAEMIGIR